MPEDRTNYPSAVESIELSPAVMTGFLRQLMIQAFADAGNLGDKTLRAKFEEDGEWSSSLSTGVLIESVTKFKPELIEKRPAIIVKRNAWNLRRLGIGDRMLGQNQPSGFDRFVVMWVGSHTLFAIAGSGAEAEKLGFEVAQHMVLFAPQIRACLHLHRFQVAEIGVISQLEEASENFVVPVSVAYATEQNWTLQQSVPRLKRISINISQLDC